MRNIALAEREYRCRGEGNSQMFSNAAVRCLLQRGGEYLLVAQAVAVLGGDSNAQLVSGVSGLDIETVTTVLEWFSRVQLLSRHGLLRDELTQYLIQSLPIDIQSSMHSRAALLLHNMVAPVVTVSRHLMKIRGVQFPWAAQVLQQAADELLSADQPRFAIQHLESAYRLVSADRDRAKIAAQLALVEWRINPSTATRNFRRLVSAVHSQTLPRCLLIPIAHYLLWHGRIHDAKAALEPLCNHSISSHTTPVEQALFHNRYAAYMFPGLAAEIRLPQSESDRLVATAKSTDLPAAQAADLLDRILGDYRESEISRGAYQMLSQHRLNWSSAFPLMLALEGLLYTDRFEVASVWCDTLSAEAMARRSPTWAAIFSGLRANISLHLGDLARASDEAKLALSYLQPEAGGAIAAATMSTLICALVAAGRLDEAQPQLNRRVHNSLYETRHVLPYLHAQGQLLLASNRPIDALRQFDRCGALMQQWQMDIPGLVAWRNGAAQAYLALGDLNAARAQAQAHIERIGGATAHSTGAESLRLIAATLDPINRIPVLQQAAAIARRTHRRFELAVILSDLTFVHERLGDRKRWRSLRQSACQLAMECGSGVLLRQLRYEFAIGEPTAATRPCSSGEDTGRLTQAERRVARMAAQGSTNREIAQTLGITTSTVEQHLTRTFKKLSITRRTELRFLTSQMGLRANDQEICIRTRIDDYAVSNSL
jgi:DNA-binding CsgD family transcriptional regulator